MKIIFTAIILLMNVAYSQCPDLAEVNELWLKGEQLRIIKLLEGNIPRKAECYQHWFLLGKSYDRMSNYAKANEALYQAYEYNKLDLPLIMALGRNYVLLGAPNYSLLFFEQAIDLEPGNQSILLELGNSYYEVRAFDKSARVFSELLEQDSTNAYYYKQLAQCYYKTRKWDEAIELLKKSFDINPRDANVAYQLSGLLVNQNEFEKAFEYIREGLVHNGQHLQLNKLAAETLFKMKHYDSASNQYELIISEGDSSALNYQKLGFCYYFVEREVASKSPTKDSMLFVKSIDAFSKAVQIDTTDALSMVYLGICYKERGEFELSISFLEKGISLSSPGYLADAYAQLGSSYDQNGKFTEAIKSYKKAQEYDHKKESLTFHLAAIYDRYYKDSSVPIMYYKKYLRESFDDDPAFREYAESRLDHLIERQHFENK